MIEVGSASRVSQSLLLKQFYQGNKEFNEQETLGNGIL